MPPTRSCSAWCSKKTGDGIRTGAEADAYIRSLNFSGMTALGTAIEERVILPFVVQRAQQHTLSKPVLVSSRGLLVRFRHLHFASMSIWRHFVTLNPCDLRWCS